MADWTAVGELYCKISKIGNVEAVSNPMSIYRRGVREWRLEKCTVQVRQRRLDQRQMYLVPEQSVRIMRYLRVCRKNRNGFGGASFRRIESTELLWTRAAVVYCRSENKRLWWLMGGRRVYGTMVRRIAVLQQQSGTQKFPVSCPREGLGKPK